ncbi:hypothetical protein, partial [Craterilacuibacter sp.]|uniref:hypothetical protein n=1 Tax=Craterilacuibacter sp. TaxID=2870909 RepID=UPI003F3F3B3D
THYPARSYASWLNSYSKHHATGRPAMGRPVFYSTTNAKKPAVAGFFNIAKRLLSSGSVNSRSRSINWSRSFNRSRSFNGRSRSLDSRGGSFSRSGFFFLATSGQSYSQQSSDEERLFHFCIPLTI